MWISVEEFLTRWGVYNAQNFAAVSFLLEKIGVQTKIDSELGLMVLAKE
ncbi:MAG: hypothetical protein Q7S82_03440 [bacterium]|nr:hypothetical protein [bacterium]